MRQHEINGKNGKELIFLENQSPDLEARSINLLFDWEDDTLKFESPYGNDDCAVLTIKKECVVRMRISDHFKRFCVKDCLDGVTLTYSGDWLYFYNAKPGMKILVELELEEWDTEYLIKNKKLKARWHGEEIIAMNSQGKRYCFFEDLPLD